MDKFDRQMLRSMLFNDAKAQLTSIVGSYCEEDNTEEFENVDKLTENYLIELKELLH